MNARTDQDYTQLELAELREQHALMPLDFRRIPFEAVMRDMALRICLVNTLDANKKRLAKYKARMAREAANFTLTP